MAFSFLSLLACVADREFLGFAEFTGDMKITRAFSVYAVKRAYNLRNLSFLVVVGFGFVL